MHIQDRFIMPQEESSPFVEKLLSCVSENSYVWMHVQAMKRNYQRKNNGASMDERLLQMNYEDIKRHPFEKRRKWMVQILTKLRKDIQEQYRETFIEALRGEFVAECVLSNPDQKGKMRRIDPMKQADKVWRLDILVMILFYSAPLESTDGERLTKIEGCSHSKLCINPTHIKINAKQIDVFISKLLVNTTNDMFSMNPMYPPSLPNPVRYNPYGGSKLRHTVPYEPFDPMVRIPEDLRDLEIKTENDYSPVQGSPLVASPEEVPYTEYSAGASRCGKIKSRYIEINGTSRSCPDIRTKLQPRHSNGFYQCTSHEDISSNFPTTFGMGTIGRSWSYNTPENYIQQVGYFNGNKFNEGYDSPNQMMSSSSQSIEYEYPNHSSVQSIHSFDHSSNMSFDRSLNQSNCDTNLSCSFNGSMFPENNNMMKFRDQQQNFLNNVSTISSQQPFMNNALMSTTRASSFNNNTIPSYVKYESIPEDLTSLVKDTNIGIDASVQNLYMINN